MKYKELWLLKFMDENCLFRCDPNTKYSVQAPQGHLPGNAADPNGNRIMFYMRRMLFNNFYLRIASRLLANKIWDSIDPTNEKAFQLGAVETGGTPLALGIQEEFKKWGYNINMFSVRKERKSYGLFHYIEGIPDDNPVVVIDDMFKSGGSLLRAMRIIQQELQLPIMDVCASVMSLNTKEKSEEFVISPDGALAVKPIYIFTKDDFDYTYDEDKYWIPADVI